MLPEWKRDMYAKLYLRERCETLTEYRHDADKKHIYSWWRDYLDEQIEKITNELEEFNENDEQSN